MSALLLLLAATASADAEGEIVITASREPVERSETPASVSILDGDTLAQLGLPLTGDAIRLLPGVSVATTGPAGSQTQLRIRGAEANHSLLFVDGIRFNDPAAANEARFELLTSDSLSQLELIRGPQSALWGSEALGGVVSVTTADPRRGNALRARAEYGSHDTSRISAQGSYKSGNLGIAATGSWIRSDGIDAVGAGGERDGFYNRSASLKAVYTPAATTELGVVGHWIDAESEFDGYSSVPPFNRVDTLDRTRNRILAGRVWLKSDLGAGDAWTLTLDASLLGSRNRNFRADTFLNKSWGQRFTTSAQLTHRFEAGATEHRLTAAAEYQRETFHARDDDNFGATNQDRKRDLLGLTGEWHAQWTQRLSTDVAVRHDRFSDYQDQTTIRASVLFKPNEHWSLHAAYGEGIAQPTFYDLYGFFPDFFVGNPNLTPESGNNFEAGVRWANSSSSIGITAFRSRLRNEIVSVFFPVSTAINAGGTSRRKGIEVEAEHRFNPDWSINANYTLLDADEPDTAGAPLRELRRARHSGNLTVVASPGPLTVAASIAYVGKRLDTEDVFPYGRVGLGDYLLGSLSVAWDFGRGVEAYARIENAFGADYEDVFGYATLGRTVHAGLRLRLGH